MVSADPARVPCTLVNHPGQLADLSSAISTATRLAIDTEVPIDGPEAGKMRVMSLAMRDAADVERAFVVDARDLDPTLLKPILTGVTADAWNATFDARVVDAAVWGSGPVALGMTWWDAQLADALIHQGRSGFTWYHGLAWATGWYLGIEALGKGTVQLSYTATDNLSDEQIRYAANDAVETLWVGDKLRDELRNAGLEQVCQIEMAAQPFLDQMERVGLPFDWPGWAAELKQIESQNRQVIGSLAALTGGGQGTLFDDVTEPNWNPGSDRQVRQALNQWAADRVKSWTASREGQPRLLTDLDSVNASVLREIGGDLCDTLLSYRNLSKLVSTYGESIHEHVHDDGRMRPQYLQVVGTNTGRLASRNPNAQNFTPRMKPYVRPHEAHRVFVHADLSQAELRFLAQVADDEPLRAAFARGDDVHVTTAATMFDFDPDALQTTDPDRFKHLRQIAKALNFGIAYGSGAAALARSLSSEGSPTSVEEAAGLLSQYRRTYPGTAAWAEARISEIQDIARDTVSIDWSATRKLALGFSDVAAIRRSFRSTNNRWPNANEVAELHPLRHQTDLDALVESITEMMNYSAPVALLSGGEPFTFASRTVSGRRQQFNLHLDRLYLQVVVEAVGATSPELVSVRSRFEHDHALTLYGRGEPLARGAVDRLFEDRALRRAYVESIASQLGDDVAHRLLQRAAKERVSAMVNAWRNAPIQGGVADIMLAAYADLGQRLRRFDGAVPVQTVHDSIVIECDDQQAPALVNEVRDALEGASRRFCPDVAPKADVDIRRSLADEDVVPTTATASYG